MANNRMFLRCSECDEQFFVAKYYPSQGWYLNRSDEQLQEFGPDLDRWLDLHKHGSMFGVEIHLLLEIKPKLEEELPPPSSSEVRISGSGRALLVVSESRACPACGALGGCLHGIPAAWGEEECGVARAEYLGIDRGLVGTLSVRQWFRRMRAADWERDPDQLLAVQSFLREGRWPRKDTFGNISVRANSLREHMSR